MELVSYIVTVRAGQLGEPSSRKRPHLEVTGSRGKSLCPASGVVCQTFLTNCVISVLCADTPVLS